jgi:GMP synthase (glutamine-hydrolysing)
MSASRRKGLDRVPSVWVLQHTATETLGYFEEVLKGHAIGFDYIKAYGGESVPARMAGKSGLIVMGGPMGVYEQAEHPFLRDEMRLIESALELGKPVLGVCLGSQLLAAALGAKVTKGERKELGWYPVTLSEAAAQDPLFAGIQPTFWPFHWHGDVFPLPKDCAGLAASKQTPCQAFRYGHKAYGLLFHLEVTGEQIVQMLTVFADELHRAGGTEEEINQQTPLHLPALNEIARTVFGRWAAML